MNRNSKHRKLSFLMIAAITLATGNASAEEAVYQVLQSGNIVMAKVILAPEPTVEAVTTEQSVDTAVTEALEGVLADNRLELDARLSGRKSLRVSAGR